ncbi:MAG: helix-turn-helix transcriptional regulator [Clostridia bacterium]|nr:helix-turn-helix transcriptional regulator [Clostridia bacterium]
MFRLRELRKEKGLSQSQVATFLGCNQTAIGKYERGQLEPNFFALKKLADYFECSVDYLIGREDDLGIVKIVDSNNSLNAKERELVDNYRKLNALEQDAIMLQTKALANKK